MRRLRAALLGGALAAAGAAAVHEILEPEPALDIVHLATPHPVVERMLQVAGTGADDVVYDLGCGDGRVVILAAKRYGARGVCIELDPERIEEALENARTAGVSHLVEFRVANLFHVDLGEATVVTLYLGAQLNLKLKPKLLRELRPGSRVVSHDFDMGDWDPDHAEYTRGRNVYLWHIT